MSTFYAQDDTLTPMDMTKRQRAIEESHEMLTAILAKIPVGFNPGDPHNCGDILQLRQIAVIVRHKLSEFAGD
jgi:hypothetical protein